MAAAKHFLQEHAWRVRFAAALVLAALAAGCTTDGPAPVASAAAPNGPPVAFESIDGPPPWVFERLVANLDSESANRNLAVVSRTTPSGVYRMRGYMAATVRGGATSIAWVWDIYDPSAQRAARISGEEPVGRAGSDPWSAADDRILRKIAQAGVDGFASLTAAAQSPVTTPPARQPAGAVVADAARPDEQATPAQALAFAQTGEAQLLNR